MKLKGTTEIILTNAKTGEVEQYQKKDNMFTKALQNIVDFWQNYNSISLNDNKNLTLMPLYEKGLGGIMLFDENLPESVDLTIKPGNVKVTGYADNKANSSGTNSFVGSYNANASGVTEDGKGYRKVWEFNTAQANGKISAISLTSAEGGACGYGDNVNGTEAKIEGGDFWKKETNQKIDLEHNEFKTGKGKLYDINFTEKCVNISILKEETDGLYKLTFHIDFNIGLRDIKYTDLKFDNKKKIAITGEGYRYFDAPVYKCQTGYFYQGKAYILNIETETEEIFDIASASSVRYSCAFKMGNKIFIKEYNYENTWIFSYDIETKKLVKRDVEPKCWYIDAMVPISDDLLMTFRASTNYGGAIFDVNTDTGGYVFSNTSTFPTTHEAVVLKNGFWMNASSYGNNLFTIYQWGYMAPYLATINNLRQPIVKNENQTLKIVYTIREVE